MTDDENIKTPLQMTKAYMQQYYRDKLKDVKVECPNCGLMVGITHKARHMQSRIKCAKLAKLKSENNEATNN